MSPRPWNAAQCTMLSIHQHPHDPAPRFQQRQQQRRGRSADIGRLNCYPSSKLGWNPSSIARGRCPRHHYPQHWSRSVGLPLDSGPLCPLALWLPLCPHISPKLVQHWPNIGQNWGQFGISLGPMWGRCGAKLGPNRAQFGVNGEGDNNNLIKV